MSVLVDLMQDECLKLLRQEELGRVAMCTPSGPHIVPVNYSVFEDSVVIRTVPYGLLGTVGRDAVLALEVDRVDAQTHDGWSVVVQGRASVVDDPDELRRIRDTAEPDPWAGGIRRMYLRLRWREISGRRVVPD
jgi:nitroimidazol reductase NimA-like FMN-containing flavoprotein (pyridoxamine 5'-phosphate oxidase superfamily)